MLKLELSWRGLLLIGLAVFGIWMLLKIWAVVLLMIVAVIFMAALLPYVELFIRWRFPRVLAVITVLLMVLAIIGGLFAMVVPAMVDEFQTLRDRLPEDARDLEVFLSNFGINVEISDRVQDIDWTGLISGSVAIDYGQRVLFGVLSAITVLVLTAYLLADAHRMRDYLYRFIPNDREPDADRILHALGRVVGGYIRGQIITSGIIGVYTAVVLAIVGVDNPLAFGVLAAFADIIPLIGAFIAIVPATVGAFSESPTQAVIVLIALLVYQQFEDRFLVPRVYGATLGLQPLVVLVAILVGGELLGIPGILLALPAAAAGKVFLDFFLEKRDPKNVFATGGGADEILAPDAAPESAGGNTPGEEGAAGRVKSRKFFRRQPKE
ncbi:MAG: AI-2E family transporter [Dehalococcoidia bacterium]